MSIIFEILNSLLSTINTIIGDWGITIIVTTLLVRIVLLPVSLKQKQSMQQQQVLSKKMEELKTKYNDDKKKLEAETAKLTLESAKSTLGCLITLLQLPIMFSLYRIFLLLPVDVGSVVVPWVISLKLPDAYFVIPTISILVQLMPNLLPYLRFFKTSSIPKPQLSQIIMITLINILVLAKAPVTIGIYWITTNFFSFIEHSIYNFYQLRSCKG